MTWMDALTVVSFFASIASLSLAVYTIWLAHLSEQRVQSLFDKTQSLVSQHFEKVNGVLAEVDKRAVLIDRTVSEAQRTMLHTLTTIVSETAIPKKADMGEQMAAAFMQSLLEDPTKAGKALEKMMPLIHLGQQMRGQGDPGKGE
jgi:hypothetical protein